MSVIATTNSTCTVKKVEYRGAEAIVYLKIVAFAKTLQEKGIMIYLKEPHNDVLIPAFRVSSEEDTYQNKIFWISDSTLRGHTYQHIGSDATIPVHIDLSKGNYKDNHLYREISIVIVDYINEADFLWVSQPLHLCSVPLNFNITGDIIPRFTKLTNEEGSIKYKLSVDYKFSEDSWLFNLQHEDLSLEMSVHAVQSVEFETREIILAETSGTWENVSAELETTAHITIKAKLKLNKSVVWQDQIVCVPGEISTLYVKKNNDIYIVTHKALQHNTLARDMHVYHSINDTCKIELLITPWVFPNGTQRVGKHGQKLYTLTPFVQNSYGKYIPLKEFFSLPISFSRIYWDNGEGLTIPYNLVNDISEDFPTIVYNNYNTEEAERILSQMALLNTSLKVVISGIVAIKQPMLICEPATEDYVGGSDAASGLLIGSGDSALIVQKGDMSYD